MFGMMGRFSQASPKSVNDIAMNSSSSVMFFARAIVFIAFNRNTEKPIKKSVVLLFPKDSESRSALLYLDMSGISSKLSWLSKNTSMSLYGS